MPSKYYKLYKTPQRGTNPEKELAIMEYKNYNPRQAALDAARNLLVQAAGAAVADGSLPEAALPDFIV